MSQLLYCVYTDVRHKLRKMRRIIILVTATSVLLSCGQDKKPASDISIGGREASKNTVDVKNQRRVTISNDKYIDTRYEYSDSNGKNILVENSLPKGGQKYTGPDNREYVYAIFWTQITNKTDSPFEFILSFTADSFELPSSPDNYFKIFLPSKMMTIDKKPLIDYGLTDLGLNLGSRLQESSSLQRTINPTETSLFYFVILFKQGVEGPLRAGLSLEDNKLYYRVNDKKIHSGQHSIKNLKLQK